MNIFLPRGLPTLFSGCRNAVLGYDIWWSPRLSHGGDVTLHTSFLVFADCLLAKRFQMSVCPGSSVSIQVIAKPLER